MENNNPFDSFFLLSSKTIRKNMREREKEKFVLSHFLPYALFYEMNILSNNTKRGMWRERYERIYRVSGFEEESIREILDDSHRKGAIVGIIRLRTSF